ncbi:helix-turn-helix domain-containing protein [Enterococcus wangshanyuanii]|uniref:XRE family transcriptional regulator n=1 Tax=Enterococcus wangshanyuanii TaxID=2005703 RepID=A0ABQ1PHC7_9ENTE|nr:Rgg/GadR/MutR family transcriptional regulator [Enterococcus wangshanyuanii]GGC97282.1 XRE family transcriptional regulator [Enterococcus wangshanyuanii]
MTQYGQTIKTIRKSRGLSQAALCTGIMSRSNLSRFEHQLYIPSFDKVLQLLERLTVTLDEFIYIDRGFLPSRYDYFYKKLIRAENYRQKEALVEVAKQIAENKEESSQFYELFLLAQLTLLENELPAVLTKKEISAFMRPVLFEIENWLFYDFRRLNNFIQLFELEEAIFLYDRALAEFAKYEGLPKENNIKIHLSLNVGQLLLEHQQVEKAEIYFKQAKQYARQQNKLYQELLSDLFIEKVIRKKEQNASSSSLSGLMTDMKQLGYESVVHSLQTYAK